MPNDIRDATKETRPLIAKLYSQYHQDLEEAGVTVSCQFEYGQDGKPALKLHGVTAGAIIKITSPRDRAAPIKMTDTRIRIDGDQWDGWNEARRLAVLDHELFHILLVRDEEGRVERDGQGRPKLKMRPHDFEAGLFLEILKRHGPAAIECDHVKTIQRDWVQLTLWG